MTSNIPTYTIKATIKTPIHIWSGEEYDRLDYFTFEDVLQIVDQKWLEDSSKKDEKLFEDILKSIKKWDFKMLEQLKDKYYDNFFDPDKFEIENIDIEKNAYKSLIQDRQYNQKWVRGNQWIIKKYFADKFTKKAMIPWSTLKWLFRSIYFFDKYWNDYKKYKESGKDIENDVKNNKYFSNLYFEDVEIINHKKSIQQIIWVNAKKGDWENKWIPLVVETVKEGYFNIDIINFFKDKDHNLDFDYEEFKEYIKSYSNIIITREEQILSNIWIKSEFIDELNDLYDNWKYPIKIWMFKKSLAYKLYWEEILDNFVYKYNSKIWKKVMDIKQSKKLWIWDKSIYLDENENPMWWIILEF